MVIKCVVDKEDVRVSEGTEYITATCREVLTDHPMLQFFDYSLRDNERHLKGKLVGKTLTIVWENVRAIFAGRPQVSGMILSDGAGK